MAAINDALYGDGRRMHSPAVFWSPDSGFYASPSSRVSPNDDLQIWTAGFGSGGKPYDLPEYADVRKRCAEWVKL